MATTGSGGLDFGAMLRHARDVGGPALRKLTFHERARMLKALGLAIMARKEELYELNYLTGATRKDGWIDIEGGAGTLFSFSSKGRRELPDAHVLLDGQLEALSKSGTFVGQHIYTPLQGAAVHINAFNFPVWGMLEKLAPTLLAGVPAIVKPARPTAYLCRSRVPDHDRQRPPAAGRDAADRRRRRRSVRPSDRPGRGQLHRLGARPRSSCARTRRDARERAVRRRAGQPQRLAARPRRRAGNARVRPVRQGSRDRDDGQGGAEVHRHPPRHGARRHLDAVEQAIRERLAKTKVGDPRDKDTRMGALVSLSQRDDVRAADRRAGSSRRPDRRRRSRTPTPASPAARSCRRSCCAPTIPGAPPRSTTSKPFGPVSTIMPYKDMADAIALANRGMGSLALSLFTHSPDAAREFVQGAAAYHGRMLVLEPRQCRRNRPATARRCPSSSMAAPAAPAAARRWAACAA